VTPRIVGAEEVALGHRIEENRVTNGAQMRLLTGATGLSRAPISPSRQSNIPAFDLFGQGFDELGNPLEPRIDLERPAKRLKRPFVVADVL
jgi:hypothetical protein